MEYFELNKNEEKIIKDFEKGNFKRISGFGKEKTRYKEYAKDSLNKVKNINIRISKKDLQKIKTKAIEKGMPYQTLVSSILHQYSDERMKEMPVARVKSKYWVSTPA